MLFNKFRNIEVNRCIYMKNKDKAVGEDGKQQKKMEKSSKENGGELDAKMRLEDVQERGPLSAGSVEENTAILQVTSITTSKYTVSSEEEKTALINVTFTLALKNRSCFRFS